MELSARGSPSGRTVSRRSRDGGPILHLPLHLAPPDARVLYASLVHFKPVVNGTLSYIPQRNVDLAETLWKVPIPEGTLERIERWPVGTIVFHEHAMPLSNVAPTLRFLESARAAGRLSSPLRFPHAGGTDWVFGVVRVRGDGGWDLLEGMQSVTIAYIVLYLGAIILMIRWNRGVLPVIAALVHNDPGQLAEIARVLANADINITQVHATTTDAPMAEVVLTTDDNIRAMDALMQLSTQR